MAGENYLAMIDENYCSRATQNNRFSYNYLVLWTIKKHPQNCLRKYILSIFFELFISTEKNNRNKNIYWKSCSFVSKYVFSCSLGQEKSSFCSIIPSRFSENKNLCLPSKHIKANKNKTDWKAKCNFVRPTFLMLLELVCECGANLCIWTLTKWNLIKP